MHRRLLLFTVVSVIASALSGCAVTTAANITTAPDFGHIHGIGVDPGDEVTYVATHTGVWRFDSTYFTGKTSAAAPKRVGPRQDTMGFAVAGPHLLFASGHPGPNQATDLKIPNLGLLQSSDGATSWKTVSLRGQVDFHDLAAVPLPAGVYRVYGYDATAQAVLVSDDSGLQWTRGAAIVLRDLAVNTADPTTVYATTSTGLQVSHDSGRTFAAVSGSAPRLFLIEQIAGSPGSFVGIDTGGTVWITNDGTATWQKHGRTQGAPQALAQTFRGTASWILAVDDRGVVASQDYGMTWSVLIAGQR
jgi:hypothetical protein